MILATHAIIGAGIAATVPEQPALGFGLAFASHFLLDLIPHWDYALKSRHEDHSDLAKDDMIINRDFVGDLAKIGLDFAVGIVFVFVLFARTDALANGWFIILLGALGGMLPDFLQFAYFKIRCEPLTSLQRFHQWIHTSHRLKKRWFIGLVSQTLLVIICLVLLL